MMRKFWIAPAVAFAAVLLFSSPAKADKWGFSARVSHGRYASRDCSPRYTYRKTYRASTYGHGDRHSSRSRDYDRHSGYDVRRSGYGRAPYRGEYRRSYRRGVSYRSSRYSRGSGFYRCR